jgi:hypothetical protein
MKSPSPFGPWHSSPDGHAANEYMVVRLRAGSTVKGLAEIEKGCVDFLFALAGE